jgi:general stress protein 26
MSPIEEALRSDAQVVNLATVSVDGTHPSNRFTYYVLPEELTNYFYVTTLFHSTKVNEIENNAKVSFTTVPSDDKQAWVGSNDATAEVIDLPIQTVAPLFEQQIDGWHETVGDLTEQDWVVLKVTFASAMIVSQEGVSYFPEKTEATA